MVRVRTRWRRCPRGFAAFTFALFVTLNFFGTAAATASECWFNNERHKEGSEVATAEPCLNCTCRQGALVCYLRVCAQLPNPPPPGCIMIHRHKKCCPELICTDFPEVTSNNLEGRSEPEDLNNSVDYNLQRVTITGGPEICVANGTVYGPGSAMASSRYCEYCFCIKGREKCVRPKCLLHLEGCKPIFESHSCCPIKYNCSALGSTTTPAPTEPFVRGGCIVAGIYYPEGSRVLGIGHTECDNCYCTKGVLRCEPMACSPPFPGCTPVISPGECCASSYNCNGTIRINAQLNYGEYPTISKEYAKLRRESDYYPRPFKLAERIKGETVKYQRGTTRTGATTRHFAGIFSDPSTRGPFYYNTVSTIKYKPSSLTDFLTSTPIGTTEKETVRSDDYVGGDVIMDLLDLLSDDKQNRKIDDQDRTDSTTETTSEFPSTETDFTDTTANTVTQNLDEPSVTVVSTTDCVTSAINADSTTEITQTISDSTTAESTTSNSEESTTILTDPDPKVDTITPYIDAKINTIINLTKGKDEDYGEYDYNHPTLPPSLPNLQIIPFVAADALDNAKEKDADGNFFLDRIDTETSNYGLFSPPTETEGGFQPPNSSIIQKLYEKNYHSTVDIPFVTSPVPAITIPPKSPEHDCMYEGRKVVHGESITTEGLCIFCVCFYGNIVCPTSQCPPPGPDCRVTAKPEGPSCCPAVICDGSSPTAPKEVAKSSEKPTLTSHKKITAKLKEKTTVPVTLSVNTKIIATDKKSADSKNRSDLIDHPNSVDSSGVAVGPLKLAGCNIYGRMYRVGRIISELSSPCRECRCTEVGVQCRPLTC